MNLFFKIIFFLNTLKHDLSELFKEKTLSVQNSLQQVSILPHYLMKFLFIILLLYTSSQKRDETITEERHVLILCTLIINSSSFYLQNVNKESEFNTHMFIKVELLHNKRYTYFFFY